MSRNLRVITWNLRRANGNSPCWKILQKLNPDVVLLQEVMSIPNDILNQYSSRVKRARSKTGEYQKFSTVLLVKGNIKSDLTFTTDQDWINNELSFFDGNLLGCEVEINNKPFNMISVYSPAWPVDRERLKGIDITEVKLTQNPDVWCSDLLWFVLKNQFEDLKDNWIVAGDFNSSVTFDYMWSGGPRGNQEYTDRMNSIGLEECLFNHSGKLVPTFRNPKGGKVIHQIDHMYVCPGLLTSLDSSIVGDSLEIFEKSHSDHLPIISDFKL